MLKGVSHYPIAIRTGGKNSYSYVQVQFALLKAHPPFNDESKRKELCRRLNEISDVKFDDDSKYPAIPLSKLKDESTLNKFLHMLDWVIQEIRAF